MTISPEAQRAPAVLSLQQQLLCLFDSISCATARYPATWSRTSAPTDPDAPIAGS